MRSATNNEGTLPPQLQDGCTTHPDSPETRNHHGQRIGFKGQRTRQSLIDATVQLLEQHGLRAVSVADVARAANTSPATFYVYFRGVPEAVLTALDSAQQTSPRLEALMDRDWIGSEDQNAPREFVDEYTELWHRNRTIFRVRNLAAEEGDERFYRSRLDAVHTTMERLSTKVRQAQRIGRVPSQLDPRACAGTILMMLERLSSIGPVRAARDSSPDYCALKEAAAHTLALSLGVRS